MGLTKLHTTYMCLDDCEWSGCPGHEAILEWQSTTDGYHFVLDDTDYYFGRGEMNAIIELLQKLSEWRCDCVQVKK